MKNDSLKGQHRINEQIRAKEVRIVGDDVEPAVYPIAQALKMAEDHEADLVEISPNAVPPVCRIIDYSKFLYQLKKRQKEQKAKQVKVNVKEIRFGPQTDDHDYNFKLKHAKGFLEDGDKVKAYVFFKGRSILFKEQGEVLLLRFANDLEEYGKVEQLPVLEGKRMIIMLTPKNAGAAAASKPAEGKKTKEQKRAEAQARAALNKKLKGVRNQLKKIETELDKKRARYDELMELMASEELYADQDKFNAALGEYNGLKQELPKLEDEWLELSTQIEEETARELS